MDKIRNMQHAINLLLPQEMFQTCTGLSILLLYSQFVPFTVISDILTWV